MERPGSPRELTSHRCIGWRWEGHELPYKWEFNSDGKWFEVEVKGPLICNSKEFCLKAAAAGLGIAFATQELIAPYLEQGTLVTLARSLVRAVSRILSLLPGAAADGTRLAGFH